MSGSTVNKMLRDLAELSDYLEPEDRAELYELIVVYIDVKKMTEQEERGLQLVADSIYNKNIQEVRNDNNSAL